MLCALALAAAAGCGEEEIALDTDAACQPSACRVKADYGSLGKVAGSAQEGAQSLLWSGDIDDECGAPHVDLAITLEEGRGVFTGGVATGSYQLVGAELDPATCGACVRLTVDEATCYFATAGTLEVSSVMVDLAGSLAGAAFARVDCATGAPTSSSCRAVIADMSFSDPIGGEPE
jgi:hypothetical protein